MTTVTPPSPPASTPPLPVAARLQLISEPPPAVAQLPVGARIEGSVRAEGPRGLIHIETAAGVIVARSSIPLPEGTQVVLTVRATTPALQLQVQLVGDPSGSLASPVRERATLPSTPTLAGPQRLDVVVDRAQVEPSAATSASGIAALTPGTKVGATVVAPAAAGAAEALAPEASPVAPTVLPPGVRLTVRVLGVQTGSPESGDGGSRQTSGIAPGIGQIFRATLVGTTPSAHTLVMSPFGTLSLAARSIDAQIASVTLEIVDAPPQAPTSPPATVAPNARPADGMALGETLQRLAALDPQMARHLLETIVPRPDARLAADVLFFLSALRGGDLAGWLGGDAADAMKRSRPDTFARLGEDFRQAARSLSETGPGDWRAVSVPLNTGGEIERIRLMTRQRPEDGDDAGRMDQGTRFILDVRLSRLGRIQLDGLVRNAGKLFDLIVRSETPLAPPLREDIRQLFGEARSAAGFSGGVGFQTSPPGFVETRVPVASEPAAALLV